MAQKQHLSVTILKPFSTEELSVEWMEIISPTGSFVVGPHHEPLISLIKAGKSIKYKAASGQEVELEVNSGVLQISHGNARLFLS